MKTTTYRVKIKLQRQMLGTNPSHLDVMDRHIIDRQRKLIQEKSGINNALNKYYQAKEISNEQAELELRALKMRAEEILGSPLTEEEIVLLKDGDFKKLGELRESVSELEEKGITCFFRMSENADDYDSINVNPRSNKVCIGSHMIMGFLKSAAEAKAHTLPTKKGKILHSLSYTKSIINQHVKVFPEMIPAGNDIRRKEDGTPNYFQRTLRVLTAQGPRTSLAKSEVLPKGTEFEFDINVLDDSPFTEEALMELLSYGSFAGLGQWRNASYGQFDVLSVDKFKGSDLLR